ncbi:MAG: hypothetical protein LBH00_04160 [Planctomycetaceae bacterium]|jgi:hypothetical protein|nr:hypothetical protein [Planctomycetaceae bacterium]
MAKAELKEIFWDDIPGGSFAEDPRFLKENYYSMPRTGWIENWQTFHCHLIQGAGFEDYQANAHFRMCSQRLKDLFENNKGTEDKIQWLDATLTWNGETRPYYALHFYECMDVVDPVASKWNPETRSFDALHPVFLREKIVNHNVFTIPLSTVMLVVKPFIVQEMKRMNMTGMSYGVAVVK